MWKTILYIVLLIGIVILSVFLYKSCKNNDDLAYKISIKDSLIKIDSTKYSKIAEEYNNEKQANSDLRAKNKELSEYLQENKETIRYYSNLVLKLKNQTYYNIVDSVKFVIIGDTIRVPVGMDTVGFDEENSLVRVHGFTFLVPNKGYLMNIDGKPFPLDIVVTEDRDGIFTGYVDTKNPDLEVTDMTVRVLRQSPGFWDNFGIFTSLNLTNQNTFIDLSFVKGRFGIRGIVGYNYMDYVIDKNNLQYGCGIIYKLF